LAAIIIPAFVRAHELSDFSNNFPKAQRPSKLQRFVGKLGCISAIRDSVLVGSHIDEFTIASTDDPNGETHYILYHKGIQQIIDVVTTEKIIGFEDTLPRIQAIYVFNPIPVDIMNGLLIREIKVIKGNSNPKKIVLSVMVYSVENITTLKSCNEKWSIVPTEAPPAEAVPLKPEKETRE